MTSERDEDFEDSFLHQNQKYRNYNEEILGDSIVDIRRWVYYIFFLLVTFSIAFVIQEVFLDLPPYWDYVIGGIITGIVGAYAKYVMDKKFYRGKNYTHVYKLQPVNRVTLYKRDPSL